MVKNLQILERGDVVWIDFSPTRGHEQSGLRPAVVVSSAEYNSFSNLVLVCPITSKQKNYVFETPINIEGSKSFVLCDQVRTFDVAERIKRKTVRLTEREVDEILAKISVLFQ